MYFHDFFIFIPCKRAGPFIWTNLNPLHPRMLCAKFGWNWLSGSGEEDFKISSMYFYYFVIVSPGKRAGTFNWSKLNPLHSRMLCAKFGWNWPNESGEEDENVRSLQTDGRTDRRTDGRTDRQADDGRQVIRKAHLSFQLRWAKNPHITELILPHVNSKNISGLPLYYSILYTLKGIVYSIGVNLI